MIFPDLGVMVIVYLVYNLSPPTSNLYLLNISKTVYLISNKAKCCPTQFLYPPEKGI